MKIAHQAQIIGACAMNNLPNVKIEKLRDTLFNIDKQLFDKKAYQKDKEIRNLIDQRRHANAQLNIEMLADPQFAQQLDEDIYATNPQTQHFITTWCARVKDAAPPIVSFDNAEFCNLFIDNVLPQKWHFDNDITVVISPPSNHITKALKDRGQKHVVVYYPNSAPAIDATTIQEPKNTYICTSTEELERLFALIQAPAHQVITLCCEIGQRTSQDLQKSIIDAVNAGKKTRFENTRTVSKFGQSWAENVVRNLPHLHNAKNLHELQVSGVKDAVIVASGPSLNKNVDALRRIQDQVFIVTALRSLPVLNAAGVCPDLVIQLDAEDDEVARSLALDHQKEIKNFLIEPTINPGFLKIPAVQIIWSLAQHYFDIHQRFGTTPTPFNVPSVSIYGLCLCHHLRFRNICFIGQDLATHGDSQYAKGATDLLPAHSKISMFNIEVPGFYGDTVMTRNSFHYQIKRCTEIAKEWKNEDPNINLVNATEGGAFIEGFDHMSLNAFATSRNLDLTSGEKQIWFEDKATFSQAKIDAYLQETSNLLDRIIIAANQVIKLDKKPEKNRGLQRKIQKTIQKFQAWNNETSLLQIAMQENIAKVIGTSETTQVVGTHAEFFDKVKQSSLALKLALNDHKS
jgi:hypothetical protein